jgi:hypothetical protein
MPKLGDSFSTELRAMFATANVSLGAVIKIMDDVAGKEKWHIIVGFSKDNIITATVRINLVVNQNCIPSALLPYQLHITKQNFDFLDHNSVVNCAELIEHKTTSFIDYLTKNTSALKGCIDGKKFDEIRSLIADCRVIDNNHKVKFNLL